MLRGILPTFRAILPLSGLLLALLGGCESSDSPGARPAQQRDERVHKVEATEVIRDRVQQVNTRTGSLRARRHVRVHAQEEGRIVELPHFESDTVAQGEILVRLDDSLLQAELRKTRATRAQAEQDLKRLRALSAKGLVSADEQLRAETGLRVAEAEESLLRTRLGYTRIVAPFAGVITERLVEPGDVAQRHQHLLTLSDPTSLIAEVTVSELLHARVAIDEPVRLRIDALGDRRFEGRISRIHPTLNPGTRLGRVEISLSPIPDGAHAGQLCRVEFRGEDQPRVLIPLDALRRDAGGEFVFRIDAEQRARRTQVRTGLILGNLLEVVDGIEAGEQVVTRGFLGLTDGVRVDLSLGASR